MKKLLALLSLTTAMFAASAQAEALLEWNFSGIVSANPPVTYDSTSNASDVSVSTLSRGAGAAASGANDSFRTLGFQNNGINLANTDYFEFTLAPNIPSPVISLSSFEMRFAGTGTFSQGAGVTMAWAYSFDGGAFTLLDTFTRVGNGTSSFDLSSIAELQNVSGVDEITFRFYASGQTTTGGWGFANTAAQDPGLVLNGVVPEPSTYALLALSGLALAGYAARRRQRQK